MFEGTNVGCDHQMLTMQVLQNTARRYGLVCLLHEKPFAGVNGSGKHNNWSMGTDTGHNLLEPGETPHENLNFLFFAAAVIQAVDTHQQLLRASIASAGPGPPARRQRGAAGDHLDLPRHGARGASSARSRRARRAPRGPARSSAWARRCCRRCRCTPVTATARARSPSPATSSSSARSARASRRAFPNTVLNTIVAEAIAELTDKLDAALKGGASLEKAILGIVKDSYRAHRRVVFNGDGYSEAWHAEAEQRGLANLRSTPDALPWLIDRQTIAVFKRDKVLTKRELEARYTVFTEQYSTRINIEAETAATIARTLLLPAALRHLAELREAGIEVLIEETADLVDRFAEAIFALEQANAPHPDVDGLQHAHLHARRGAPGDGRGARDRRPPRADRRRRPLAAAEVLGDALHQVARGRAPSPETTGAPGIRGAGALLGGGAVRIVSRPSQCGAPPTRQAKNQRRADPTSASLAGRGSRLMRASSRRAAPASGIAKEAASSTGSRERV